MSDLTRRDLAKGAALATAASYSRIMGANDRVRMGYIGVGNRGDQVHDAFLETGSNETVAVCDLRDDYMEFAIKKSRANARKYKEYRDLLADKGVDAVVIATPDHWHALMMIDACNAGKDVYVEKPLSLTVVEGRIMVEAAERTGRVSQVGTQRRSTASNTTGASRQKRYRRPKELLSSSRRPGSRASCTMRQLKLGPRRAQKAPQPIPVPMGSVRAPAVSCACASQTYPTDIRLYNSSIHRCLFSGISPEARDSTSTC